MYPAVQPVEGYRDVLLARYDRHGHQQWMRQFGSEDHDVPISLVVHPDDDVSAASIYDGEGESIVIVARYGPNGEERHNRRLDLPGFVRIGAVQLLADGRCLVASAPPVREFAMGPVHHELTIVCLGPDGQEQWRWHWQSDQVVLGVTRIALASDGNLWLTGYGAKGNAEEVLSRPIPYTARLVKHSKTDAGAAEGE